MRIKNYKLDELLVGKEFLEEKKSNTYKYFIYIVIFFILSLLVWSYFAKIDLKAKGIGVVQNKNNISIIKNYVNAKVVFNNMKTGKVVKKEEILLKLDDASLNYKYDILNTKLEENKNLLNYLDGKSYKMDSNILNFELELNNLKLKIKSEDLNLHKFKKELKDNKRLYSFGGVSKDNLEDTKRNYDTTVYNKKMLLNQLENFNLNKKNELIKEIDNLNLEINKTEELKDKLIIKSPIDGIIEVVTPVNIGDTINGETLANIVPEKNEYEVKVYVSERYINKIKLNSRVNYILSNNNEEDIYLHGKVKYISSSPQEIKNEIYYYLICNIEDTKELKLKNGKTLETSIVYGEKTIFNYVVDYIRK
ncbi:HlyD family secretion protein [Oceanivirga salmonicida]|uniref:HlyD family secretion protein n=1 Tax=Oceanivirga salmonicida TaxID=1769291 RepID=UPI00083323D9|nr:HlyD family secretion protein [Oceanivirga salmonicida]